MSAPVAVSHAPAAPPRSTGGPDPQWVAELHDDITATGGDTRTVLAPATGEPLHELPLSTPGDVADAFARARLAQVAWARAGFAHRRRVLLRAHDLIVARREQLIDLVQLETGKTRGQAFEEVYQSAASARYNALAARGVLRSRRVHSGAPTVIEARVRHRPRGVAGVITPWNFPLSLAGMDVFSALAAGCGVVQKADEQAALNILELRRAAIDAGLPGDLWAVVTGDGATIGEAVTDHADVIAFTGSTATGRRIARKAAERLVPASLELGGKNPMIVLDDVDPGKAARQAAYACYASMGQLCVSPERIYVTRGVADAFTRAFVRVIGSMTIDPAPGSAGDVGTLTGQAQLDRVRAHLDDATAKGATVLAGGAHRPDIGPYAFEPTLLADVSPDMHCFAEETFGAIVSLYVVDDEEEAVLAANASDYGLNAVVLSGSVARARRVAAALETGSVNINEGYRGSFGSIAAPMGGSKQSGLGRRNGPDGLKRYVESVTVASATGLIQAPTSAREWRMLEQPMLLLLRAQRVLRRR
ncbi:succinic semialdehyde dehydrogenase [Agromyces rhizosphaerae]|uniref:Succinic semialdehyde dehydrogenase n=1 Tax=Agromyces rhizosphaerae TaxID=88374 RepID=A0A9W6CSZ0_9MICO|nr:succinic semialdehyde dehydrogenase [Agromyces rhizosphaerae]GLI28421.1 succinic semialdehyde dehydrogenase [Agromyces rhizosphaerae]